MLELNAFTACWSLLRFCLEVVDKRTFPISKRDKTKACTRIEADLSSRVLRKLLAENSGALVQQCELHVHDS